MILEKIPDGVPFFNAVVVYSFTLQRLIPILEKHISHKSYPGQCGFVAGRVEPGEDIFDASERELGEETGNKNLRKDIVQLGLSYPTRHWNRITGEPFYFIAHMMLCVRPLKGVHIDPREHRKYFLVTEQDILADKFNLIPDAFDNFLDCRKIIKEILKT